MTHRKTKIIKYVAFELREADGLPMDEAVLHFKVHPYLGDPEITLTELREALSKLETLGLCRGLPGVFESMKWAITDKGRLADI
jgi:hypothetical protein